METIGITLLLVVLFYLLGKSADLVVESARTFGKKFGIRLSFLGLILGFLTSLPELSIGVNAAASRHPDISLGNLLGGVVVLFGLILGVSVIVERRIATNGGISGILPAIAYLFLPLLFGLDGTLSLVEGLILMVAYCFILVYFYRLGQPHNAVPHRLETSQGEILRIAFRGLVGIAVVVIISHFIVNLTVSLLVAAGIPAFIAGLVIFSVGTNLPEIMVSIRSWAQHIRELSLANLVGSALANGFIAGLVATLAPIVIVPPESFHSLAAVSAILLAALLGFWKSGRALTRREGIALVALYLVFVASQLFLATAFSTPPGGAAHTPFDTIG
ncbi:MAG: hypothetical protein AAB601_00330 [Patescibacteria group bacterium]